MPRKNSIVSQARESVPGFEQIYNKFVLYTTVNGYSESLRTNYVHHLAKLCLKFGRLPEHVGADEYMSYYAEIMASRSGSSLAHVVYAVRKYFSLIGAPVPFGAQVRIPKRKTLPVVMSERELSTLLRMIPRSDILEKAMLGLLADTGLRRSELLSLKIADVDFDRSRVHVVQSKRNKDRSVPVSPSCLAVLRAYVRERSPQAHFFEREPGVRVSDACLTSAIAEAVGRAGIRKKVTAHTFRHTYASLLLEHGTSIRAVQEYMGHRSINSTAVYLHLANVDTAGQRPVGLLGFVFPM